MRHPTKHLRLFLTSLVAAGLLAVIAAPAALAGQHNAAPGLARAIAAQELYTNDLLAIPVVVGTAVGRSANGDPVVKIYTARDGVAGLPRALNAIGVRVEVTGAFFAVPHKDKHNPGGGNGNGDGVDPKARFTRPVPIGVSSGTTRSITDFSCSTGTLGARLSGGGKVYALSNNHVYALENAGVVDGPSVTGDTIVQPGPVDTDPVCDDKSGVDDIGTLAAYVMLKFDGSDNTVDAAIAETTMTFVGTATPGDGYGEPKTNTLVCGDCLGMAVQKFGRTSGLKKGTISGINATVNIGYSSGTARFVGQIIVSGSKGPFIKGGDSGSLLVVKGGTDDRKPVGLLFAGTRSGKTAIANRIDLVLSELSNLVPGMLAVDGEAPAP